MQVKRYLFAGERERGRGRGGFGLVVPTEREVRGDGLGAGIELTSEPYSSVEEREGVRVLAGCWNWAKQAENEGEGREMDSPFLFFFNLF